MNLRFATDILKRLGEELNESFDRGVMELVKNAYDADAAECIIELDGVDDEGGTVRVFDDGDGMTQRQIETGWLVVGRSGKQTTQLTRLGRYPAGSKGLGRLASLRLGRRAILKTRPADPSERGTEYKVVLDWEEFDGADLVEEVDVPIIPSATSADPGTTVEILDLTSRLRRMDVKRLARGLIMLSDPFGDDPSGFHPVLRAPSYEDLERLVQRRYLGEATYHLKAQIDAYGSASAVVTDARGGVLFEAPHSELRRPGDEPYDLPPLRFDFWVFLLDRQTFATRIVSISEVREWLAEFGGVHLYLGGIRIAPYGEPEDDWLELNLSKAREPYLRPTTRTSIGRIRIAEPDARFEQTTDRGGLIENEAYYELREFAKDAMDWLARCRRRERERERERERDEARKQTSKERLTMENAIAALPPRYRGLLEQAFARYERSERRARETLEREVQLYRTLSTIGIVATTFAHEARQPIDLIIRNAKQIARRAKKLLNGAYDEALSEPVETVRAQAEALEGYGGVALGLAKKDKRREGRVEVHKAIRSVTKDLRQLFADRDVSVTTRLAVGKPYLHGSTAALESILTNLLMNAVRAFNELPPQDRRVEVRTEVEVSTIRLSILDNGPGIQGISLKDIWLPGQTTFKDGTGFGLTIVRDTVGDLSGRVEVEKNGELGGASFHVELPIIGV